MMAKPIKLNGVVDVDRDGAESVYALALIDEVTSYFAE